MVRLDWRSDSNFTVHRLQKIDMLNPHEFHNHPGCVRQTSGGGVSTRLNTPPVGYLLNTLLVVYLALPLSNGPFHARVYQSSKRSGSLT